jgi:hypothetical protein
MSTRDFTANVISATKVVPSGPYQNSTASGVWDLSEQFDFRKGGNWPETGNALQRALFGPRTLATGANFADFGDLTDGRVNPAGFANNTRGVVAGGQAGGPASNIIDYITIASTGDATDFGDLTGANENLGGGFASSTRGIIAGGYVSASRSNVIQYVTIGSTGNATDFGDLTEARSYVGGLASATRGVTLGGQASSTSNIMDYVTIGSTGNASDFGDLTAASQFVAGASSATRGIRAGGSNSGGGGSVNTIDYITIGSTGNAQDFGDLSSSTNNDGLSGAASSTPSSQP